MTVKEEITNAVRSKTTAQHSVPEGDVLVVPNNYVGSLRPQPPCLRQLPLRRYSIVLATPVHHHHDNVHFVPQAGNVGSNRSVIRQLRQQRALTLGGQLMWF